MSKLTSRGYSSADASAFMARCRVPHTVQWQASVWRSLSAGGVEQRLPDVPIVGGQLTIDSSDPIRRRLTIDIGGGDALVPVDEDSPLLPMGNFLRLYLRIDRTDGSWFPWLAMGEMPIRSYTLERPAMIATLECTDWSGPVDDYLHTAETSYAGKTLTQAVRKMVNDAVPYRNPATNTSAHADNAKVTSFVAQAATSRWETAMKLCDTKGEECLFAADGTLVIRPDRVDGNDDGTIATNGPDVGTRAAPVATIDEGVQGNLVALTASVTRDGAVNGVFYPLSAPRKHQDRSKPGVEEVFYTARALQSTGPGRWGDAFGFIPSVNPKQVQKITDEMKTNYDKKAAAQLRKRRGVIRQIDLDAAAVWWLEADDLVTIKWAGRVEDHYAQSVTFDLSNRDPVRIRCRQLNVADPT